MFFFLTIYTILQANVALLPVKATRYLNFKILDTSSAVTTFVALLGALVVRHQFAVSLLPRINYKSANAFRTDTLAPALSYKTWRVEIRNSGLGAAIVNRAEYRLGYVDSKSGIFVGTYRDTIVELSKADLIRDRDYWIENIATGFTLSPKDDCFAFEIKAEHLAKIKTLIMVLYFQNQLGGKYMREISFVPLLPAKATHN